jgi:hypothetical protein
MVTFGLGNENNNESEKITASNLIYVLPSRQQHANKVKITMQTGKQERGGELRLPHSRAIAKQRSNDLQHALRIGSMCLDRFVHGSQSMLLAQ